MEKGKKKIVIGVIIFAVIAIIAVVIILAAGGGNNTGNSNQNPPTNQNGGSQNGGEEEENEPTYADYAESSLVLDRSYVKSLKWDKSITLGTTKYSEVAANSADKDLSISVKLYQPISGKEFFDQDQNIRYYLTSGTAKLDPYGSLRMVMGDPDKGFIQVLDITIKRDTDYWFVYTNPGGSVNILTYSENGGYSNGGYVTSSGFTYAATNQLGEVSSQDVSYKGGRFMNASDAGYGEEEGSNEINVRVVFFHSAEAKQVKDLTVNFVFQTKGLNGKFELPIKP